MLTEKLTQLGKYTLSLTTMIKESNATAFGGRELPSYELKFAITGKENTELAYFAFAYLLSSPEAPLTRCSRPAQRAVLRALLSVL